MATKTTYASFLLYSLFTSGVLGAEAANTKALIFNVKGEDLLYLDQHNRFLDDDQIDRYRLAGLPADRFASVGFFAPPRRGDRNDSRRDRARGGITSFYWTLEDFCRNELLPFLFADAEDDRQQYTLVVGNVTPPCCATRRPPVTAASPSTGSRSARSVSSSRSSASSSTATTSGTSGRAAPSGRAPSVQLTRRLHAAIKPLEHLVRADLARPDRHRIELHEQVTVVDLHNLNDRAKRFVVGVTLRRQFEAKERSGSSRPLLFVVLDELNKYAPRDGSSPIKEILLDVGERGRSLGDPRRRPADRLGGGTTHRRQLRHPGGGPARRRRGHPVRVRVPDRGEPPAGDHPAPGSMSSPNPSSRSPSSSRSRSRRGRPAPPRPPTPRAVRTAPAPAPAPTGDHDGDPDRDPGSGASDPFAGLPSF